MSIKKCLHCETGFVPRTQGVPQKFCSRQCQGAAFSRKEQLEKPDQVRARRAAFRKNNPRSVRNSELKKHYGITLEQYEQMLINQGHNCAICKKPGKLVVDHCHKTNKVRGLLHANCNVALGHLQDDPEAALQAASYLALGGF